MDETARLYPVGTRESAGRLGGTILSYAIAAGCLYWVFHDISFRELLQSLARANWWWVPPAIALDLLVYVCAAWEWQLLLRPLGRISFRQTNRAVFAGRFANDILPVHAGYIVRIYLASRWMGRRITAILPSLLIERLFDALWLALGIALTALFFPLPDKLARGGEVLAGLIVLGIVVVAWVIMRQQNSGFVCPGFLSNCNWKVARQFWAFVEHLADGVRAIGRSYVILAALGLSVLKLLLQGGAFLLLLIGYGFPLSFWVKLAVFMIAYIGISMPSTPAGVGVFQLFCTAGLQYFGVAKPAASGFALLAYVALTAPLMLAGLVAVARSGLTPRQIRHDIREWKRVRE